MLGTMSRIRLLLLTAVAPLAWGTTYLVTTEMLPDGHPLFAALLRSLPAGLLALVLSRRLPVGGWWLKSLALGALNIGAFFPLLFLAAERLPGGAAAAVAGTQPLIVLMLGAALLDERIRLGTAIAAVAGTVGVALVVLSPAAQLDLLGVLAAVGGVTATGLGMILTKRWGRPAGIGAIAYAGWQLSAGGLLLLPVALLAEGVPPRIDGTAWIGYLWLGTAGGIVAYTLWFRGIQQLPVIAPGLLALLSPVVAAALGLVFVGETFTPLQVAGFLITLGALISGQVVANRRASDSRTGADPSHPTPRTAVETSGR